MNQDQSNNNRLYIQIPTARSANTIAIPNHNINHPQRQNNPNSTPNQRSNSHSEQNQQTNFTDMPESSSSRSNNQHIPMNFSLYLEQIIEEGIKACQGSILGKIITEKLIHVSSIHNGLDSIWGFPAGLKIQEIERKILQFFMQNSADQERILQGNPWIFRNSWLIVHPWYRKTDPYKLDFEHAAVWIQLWGLPPHCKTKKMGESVGELLGKVEASELYEYPGKKMIIKIKVAINVHQPIAAGILIGNANDGTNWIDFRYEKLPQVCFKCGLLGHAENLCHNQQLDMRDSAPLGPWIRSNQYGRRVMEAKDRKYHNNPSMSKEFGHFNPPIPTSMIEQMKAMKIQEEMEAARAHQQSGHGSSNNMNQNKNMMTTPHNNLGELMRARGQKTCF
jgi:hypothetical protein